MDKKNSKYALVDGREAVLVEVVSHAFSAEAICVFKDYNNNRHYVTEAEWQAGAEEFASHALEEHVVTSESPGGEKVALFRSLFRGREDVYAHGYAKKDGGIGYTPACSNGGTRRCPRWTRKNRDVKCVSCPMREFVAINNQAIVSHFKGERDDCRDVMGLYVLLPDCTTWVLVADFDKEGWQRETVLYRDACRRFGLFPAVERSRSGNGSHVWLFFNEPVDAELARNLGCALITYAMSQADGMSFKSYDRFFPTQSTIPEGGFGNLISLPLQGQAKRSGNSVFVDDAFEPYPDQWRFLSSVVKVSLEEANAVVESFADGPFGRLAFSGVASRGNQQACETGMLQGYAQQEKPSAEDFSKAVSVVKRNMLYVSKQGLSPKAQNRVRRLAAFGNPEFFKAQAMHRSVHNIERIVWCGEENGQSIMLPRGCKKKLVDLLAEHGCSCVIDDQRSHGAPINVEFAGELRSRQQEAANAMLRHENGVLSAPTGFGKTVVAAYIIGELKMRTLVIVPKANLIDQWKSRLEQFLHIEDDREPILTKSGKPSRRKRPVIGQIGGGKNAPSGIVDIATFQSLTVKDDLGIVQAKPVVEGYGLVICDECHYGAAPSLELVMKSVNARRVYGLSATPKRSDGLEGIIYLHCGPIRHKVDPKEQAAEQGFRRFLKPRFTRIRLASLEPGSTFNQVVDSLCAHDVRNKLIVEDAADAVRAGRTPLVITKRKEHAALIAGRLSESGIKAFLLTGEGTVRDKRERIEQIHSAADTSYVIVATGSYIGEGFDLPQLDTLLLASPYSWEGVITQYSGRLHREREGKDDVVVYDYVDTSVPMLERMYKRRLKTYAKLGYEVVGSSEVEGPGARIVTGEAWQADFLADLSHASKCVTISAPYANPKLVETIVPGVSGAVARGVGVQIMLKTPKNASSCALQADIAKALEDAGCKVEVSEGPLTGIAIFDDKVAWYGTLPLLAFAKKDDCSLRVDSAEVAADLKKALDERPIASQE